MLDSLICDMLVVEANVYSKLCSYIATTLMLIIAGMSLTWRNPERRPRG
jgi:hypothetical protein